MSLEIFITQYLWTQKGYSSPPNFLFRKPKKKRQKKCIYMCTAFRRSSLSLSLSSLSLSLCLSLSLFVCIYIYICNLGCMPFSFIAIALDSSLSLMTHNRYTNIYIIFRNCIAFCMYYHLCIISVLCAAATAAAAQCFFFFFSFFPILWCCFTCIWPKFGSFGNMTAENLKHPFIL